MKNKKIIFIVAIICCLVVCWLCFGAWSIVDTSFTLSNFQYSTSSAYLYIVPSPNIITSEYSNIQISGVYTNSGGSSTVQTSAFTGLLANFSTNTSGLYYKSASTFASNRAVRLDVGVSAVDTSIGMYSITASYIVDSVPSLVSSPSYRVFSNFSYASFGASDYRTLILFIDKVSAGGVPQDQYDSLLQRFEDLEEDYSDLESDYDDLVIEAQEFNALYQQELQLNAALNTQLTEVRNDRDAWENYAHGVEEQYDELFESNALLQHNYDMLLREYNIIVSENESIGFVARAFQAVGDILEIEILPQITIGTVVSIPLILGVVFLVLRLVRGE